ncbi:MAG: hypothetical protein R6U86_04710 [Bacteroidales bacterium]
MEIIEVRDKKTAREFLHLPRLIYANDPNWISHLDQDVEAIFDPDKNPRFRSGEATRWILKNNQGELIGRIAAFVNEDLAYSFKQPTGGMGFFECIDDREAAFLLFDTCKAWLEERGMEAMDGPVNFGEKDRFWGLLVEGHGHRPPYLMNYQPPYYKGLLEAYGFQNYYEQYVYHSPTDARLSPLLEKAYQRLIRTQGYHFEHLQIGNLEKYARDFMTIYNKAWKKAHKNFREMTLEEAVQSFKEMRSVIDEELIVFGYHEGEPVAFFIGMPELNELFRFVDGKLNTLGKIKFLYHRWRGRCRTIYGMVFGVVPEYQKRGLESGLIMSLKDIVSRRNFYKSIIITWIGDFNPQMIKIIEHLGAEKIFTLVTYRKLFREGAVFERHPMVGAGAPTVG